MKPLQLEGLETDGDWTSWAVTSPCRRYRYALGRNWDPEPGGGLFDVVRPLLSIVMMNPSVADHRVDDPTIRKVIHFAKQEGCGGLLVRNLAAWRATDPAALGRVDDPIGPRNVEVLMLTPPPLLLLRVAAWGGFKSVRIRRRLLEPMGAAMSYATTHVLGLTDSGEPRHPLYLKNETRAVRWSDAREARP